MNTSSGSARWTRGWWVIATVAVAAAAGLVNAPLANLQLASAASEPATLDASTFPQSLDVGSLTRASATLDGDAPSGSLTFSLFGPGDETCTNAVHTSTATVATPNTFYQSSAFAVQDVGVYRWVVSYSGDSNNGAVATDCGDDRLVVQVDRGPVAAMRLVKSAEFVDVDGNGPSPGDHVNYRFTIDNTGTVEVFDVQIDDPMLGGPIGCPGDFVPAGGSLVCGPVAHTLGESDLGITLDNSATASASAFVGENSREELVAIAQVSVAIPPPCAAATTEPPPGDPTTSSAPTTTSVPTTTSDPATNEVTSTTGATTSTSEPTTSTSEPTTSTSEPTSTTTTTTSTSTTTTSDPTPSPTGTVLGFGQGLARFAPAQVDVCGTPPPAVSSPPATAPPVTPPPTQPPAPPVTQPPAGPPPVPATGGGGGGASSGGGVPENSADPVAVPTGRLPATR